jgi:TPR repeat protein
MAEHAMVKAAGADMLMPGDGRSTVRSQLSRGAATFVAACVFAFAVAGAGRAGSIEAPGPNAGIAHYPAGATRLVRLALRGNARAQSQLGFMYEYGRGMPQNFVLAAAWYSRAAEQGDPTGQYLLGLMYDKGRGVPQDAVLAHKWLILAATRCGSRERDAYSRLRDAVATKMSAAQIALAQYLASSWAPVRER